LKVVILSGDFYGVRTSSDNEVVVLRSVLCDVRISFVPFTYFGKGEIVLLLNQNRAGLPANVGWCGFGGRIKK